MTKVYKSQMKQQKAGKVVCFASVVLKIPLLIAESLVTTGMACYRLHVLRTIVNIVRLRTMQIFILVTWCFAVSYISILVGADMVGYFDPYLMGCGGLVPDPQWRRFQHTAGIILSFVPVLLIIITNIWILCIAGKYARKRTGQLVPSRSAVTMVACICWAFIISWVPYLTIWMCKFLGVHVPSVYRSIAEHAITINAIINPFIYTATNNTFRLFLKDLLCGKGVKHKESFRGGSLISQSVNSRVSNAGEGRGHTGPAWFVMEIRNAARKLSSVKQNRDVQGEKLRDVRAGRQENCDVRAGRLEHCGLEEDTGVVC